MSQTTTTELPPLAEAMTASALTAHVKEITRLIGTEKAHVHISPMGYGGNDAYIACNTNWCYPGDEAVSFVGKTWPEAIGQAYAWAHSRPAIDRDKLIRRLALAIIDLTDQHGECTERLLRTREFSSAEIREHHEAACTRANEMAGGVPFRVVLAAE